MSSKPEMFIKVRDEEPSWQLNPAWVKATHTDAEMQRLAKMDEKLAIMLRNMRLRMVRAGAVYASRFAAGDRVRCIELWSGGKRQSAVTSHGNCRPSPVGLTGTVVKVEKAIEGCAGREFPIVTVEFDKDFLKNPLHYLGRSTRDWMFWGDLGIEAAE